MNNSKTFKALAAAAILTGAMSMTLSACHHEGSSSPKTKAERHGCNANGCKGKNSCKDKNSCKGENGCNH